MKTLRNILTNPIGITIAVIHWIVVIFATYEEKNTLPYHFNNESLLTQWLYLLNFLPIMFAGIILSPIFTFFEQNSYVLALLLLLNFLAITFQWLAFGYLIGKFIDAFKLKELN